MIVLVAVQDYSNKKKNKQKTKRDIFELNTSMQVDSKDCLTEIEVERPTKSPQ